MPRYGIAMWIAGLVLLVMVGPVAAGTVTGSVNLGIAPATWWSIPQASDVIPVGMATDSGGYVYATDGVANAIWKYTPSGVQVARMGSTGSGPGQFQNPQSVAVNATGYIYVADTGNYRVQVLSPSGTFVTEWGSQSSGAWESISPRGIAVNGSGYVYVADPDNNRIQVFTPSGGYVTEWISSDSYDLTPSGIAVNTSGYVYVTDEWNADIHVFSPSGGLVTEWDSGCYNQDAPFGIAVNGSGYVYVSDESDNRVRVFGPSGESVGTWGEYGFSAGLFSNPAGIATGTDGSVYVADWANCRVQMFSPSGKYLAQWGSGGNQPGKFLFPQGVAVNGSGYVYVADTHNYRVQVFSPAGAIVTRWGSAGTGAGQFGFPHGIAVNGSGYVYVTDRLNDRVQVFSPSGGYVTQWGSEGTGPGYFGFPMGIIVNGSGYVYVADADNHRIQVFSPSGAFMTAWGSRGEETGQFDNPSGIAVDGSGQVYVADTENHRIQVFSPSGTYVRGWGSYGHEYGQFWQPSGVAVNESGYVYVADTYNNRVQVFTSGGTYVDQWGTLGSGDGELRYPIGLVFDSSGDLYIADAWNSRILHYSTDTTAPVVTGSTPAAGMQGSTVAISSLAGRHFLSGATVYLNRTGSPRIAATNVSVVSPTKITCRFAIPFTAAAGPWNIEVRNPDGKSGTGAGAFTVKAYPAPVIVSSTPAAGVQGSTVAITNLSGRNFVAGAKVYLNRTGSPLIVATNISVVSPTKITCRFTIPAAATAGPWNVDVKNVNGRLGTRVNGFTVTAYPTPVVSGIAPAAGLRGRTVTITNLSGNNFVAGAKVFINKTGYPRIPATDVVVVSARKIRCNVTIPANAPLGPRNIEVKNVNGRVGKLVGSFNVKAAAAPKVVGIAPASGQRGKLMTITDLSGTGFVGTPAPKVQFIKAGKNVTATNVTVVNPAMIVCTVKFPANAVTGAWNVRVTNGDGQTGAKASAFTVTV